MYACTQVCMYVCMCLYASTYAKDYTYIHIKEWGIHTSKDLDTLFSSQHDEGGICRYTLCGLRGFRCLSVPGNNAVCAVLSNMKSLSVLGARIDTMPAHFIFQFPSHQWMGESRKQQAGSKS